jgi:DDE superfamily endonuclease
VLSRRETRQRCGQMVAGLLMELEDHNCWTMAEAAGHRGPHRLQHLLSRAVWDDQRVLDVASVWAAGHLDDGDAVLIVDETADAKSFCAVGICSERRSRRISANPPRSAPASSPARLQARVSGKLVNIRLPRGGQYSAADDNPLLTNTTR